VKKELYHEALDKLMENLEVNLDAILILQQAINISDKDTVVNTDSILSSQQTNILNDHLPNSINNVSMIIRANILKKC